MGKMIDIRESGSWQLSALLAAVECLLLLFAAMGPQYGDSAIGNAMLVGWAIALFAIQLLVVTPILVTRAVKLGHDFGTSADLWLFGPLAAGPIALILAFVVSSARA
jgi:hypothetical protein